MVIPDTSVFVAHMKGAETLLAARPSRRSRRLLHPFVRGELLLGGISRHRDVLELLDDLLPAPVASAEEVALFIEHNGLAGTGVGYVDVHLLASARMVERGRLLTLDKRLHAQAERLGIACVH